MWHHGCIDRFSHKGSIYGSVTFLMVEINYSQVRIKADTRSGRWAVATVGGSINSPNKQAELLRVDCRNSWVFFLFLFFLEGFFCVCVFFNKRGKRVNKWNRDNSYVCWHKGGVGSVALQGLTNGCVDISTCNTPGRSCRAVRRESQDIHRLQVSLTYTL